uniref:Kinesin family member 26A n=1 Tax=Erpetoichthys calabaricus TaxID=27687 RepID=A0A8C4SZW3_ERPCA
MPLTLGHGVVEGCSTKEAPVPLPLGPRKRLQSAEEDQCGSRPPPEGAGSVSVTESSPLDRMEEKGNWCKKCQFRLCELKKQALALAVPGTTNRTSLSSKKRENIERGRCDICATHFSQLRHEALQMAQAFAQAECREAIFPVPSHKASDTSLLALPSCKDWALQSSRQVGKPVGPLAETQRKKAWLETAPGVPKPSVQVTVGAGALSSTLNSVTIQAQQYLEGMWSISRVNSFLPQTCGCCELGVLHHAVLLLARIPPDSEADGVNEPFGLETVTSLMCPFPPSTPHLLMVFLCFSLYRAAQKLNLSSKRKKHHPPLPAPQESSLYPTNFSAILQLYPPPAPPCLLRAVSKVKDNPGIGKVKVMVRICPSQGGHHTSESMSFLKVDPRKKQLTLYDPAASGNLNSGHRRAVIAVPKMFAFDAVFTQDASQAEVCSGTVAEVIQSVVNGADGCVFCFGHVRLGKTFTMIGKDNSTQNLGIIPCAISWLFKLINERKEKTGTRFSIRVSAVEICGKDETLKDLLSDVASGSLQDGQSPGVYLREDPICGTQLQNQSELRAPTAEKAALFLDAAVAARSTSRVDCEEEDRRNSHMLFTLHIYQYRMEKSGKGGMSGGRSRLHLIDLGSCEKVLSKSRDGGGGLCLSLTALGNVVLALANGAKHVPYKDSKLTMLLRESLGNINCRTTMIAHISDLPVNYAETLTTIQLASRIHRMRKKKSKYASSSSGGESSCEEGRSRRPSHLRPFHPRTVALDPDMPVLSISSDPDYSSSSEQSCDTVIYVGPGGAALSDRELTDNEGPPEFVPIIPSLNRKRVKDSPAGAPRSFDRDHFKCNTFAELQERLDCIDGSEEPSSFTPKPEHSSCLAAQSVGDRGSFEQNTRTHADGEKLPVCGGLPKGTAYKTVDHTCEPVVREKAYSRRPLPKPAPPPPQLKDGLEFDGVSITRTPPVGMSHQSGKIPEPRCSPVLSSRHPMSRSPVEISHLRSTLRNKCFNPDILTTTVTLQQPVELNGEDELVFTVVEELSIGGVLNRGRPSSIISFNSDCSLQALASGSRPVSIISSINDEFDAYTSQMEKCGANVDMVSSFPQEALISSCSRRSSISSWLSEVSVCSMDGSSAQSCNTMATQSGGMEPEGAFCLDALGMLHGDVLSPQIVKCSMDDSGFSFSELDGDSATSSKLSLNVTKCPSTPESTKVAARSGKASACSLDKATTLGLSQTSPTQNCHDLQDDPWLMRMDQNPEAKSFDSATAGKLYRSGTSLPMQLCSSSQRVVDGCEKSSNKKSEVPSKMPQLKRGATTLGTVPVIPNPSSTDFKGCQDGPNGNLRYSSLGKKATVQKATLIPKPGGISPPAPPIRKSSLDQKNRVLLPPSALKSAGPDAGKSSMPRPVAVSEDELDVRSKAELSYHKYSSLKIDHGSTKMSGSLKARATRSESGQCYGSQMSLERCDSLTSVGSKVSLSRENSGASLGHNGKAGRSVPRLGVPPAPTSPPSCIAPGPLVRAGQVKGNVNPKVVNGNGSKARSLSASSSKPLSSSTKSLTSPTARGANLPPSGKAPARSVPGVNGKPGRGTIMGTKQAIRAANSRVTELASGSSGKVGSFRGSGDSDSGNDSGVNLGDDQSPIPILPSPYSKITAPRRPQRYSSGHGSDNSSILSGELPPAMGRTALFYHSGGSSGYESMIRDSEATGSASSAHDSMSESGMSSSGRTRTSKSPKKRSNGLQRRRLIPAPMPDTSSLGRKPSTTGQWVDLPPLAGTLKEPFEIKVYEIDDVERLQRHRLEESAEGLLYFNAKLKLLERRQQQIKELKKKHEILKEELEGTKQRLMMDPGKWLGEFEVDPSLDKESQEYLEALEQATEDLEYCVNLCKSHVMMVTCFDIGMVSDGPEGLREVEV